MKPTTKQPRKALATPGRFGLLAAASGFALVTAVTGLSAQSVGETAKSGGFTTAGIPIGDDVYGLEPVAVGPAARPTGVQEIANQGGSRIGEPVRRGRWVTSVSPFAEASVTYSDNINLDVDGAEEEDLVATGTLGATFTAQNERLAGQLAAQISYDTFLNDTNDDGIRANVITNWSAVVIPNLFNVDVAGGIAETFTTNDRFSGNQVANSDDRERTFFGLISPSLRKNIGGWANAEVRYTARAEYEDDDDQDGGVSHTFSAGLTGDPRKFRRFGWQAATEYELFQPQDGDDDDLKRWTSYASVDVPVSRTIAITGTAGYDFFDDDVADDDLSGVFGNAGLRWQPTTRFAARAYGGYRYDGIDYGAEASYALRDNIVAGFQARRGVQFTDFTVGNTGDGIQSLVGANGRLNNQTPNALGTATGTNGSLTGNNLTSPNGEDNDAIVDTLQAYLTGTTGRTSWNANVQAARSDFGSAFGGDEIIVSANAEVSRELTSRLALNAGIGFSAISYDDPAVGSELQVSDNETISLGLGLNYQLTEIVNVFGRYTYTKRFADLSDDEFTENAGVIGVTASF